MKLLKMPILFKIFSFFLNSEFDQKTPCQLLFLDFKTMNSHLNYSPLTGYVSVKLYYENWTEREIDSSWLPISF